MGKLSDRVAVITGAASGIGRATAERFAAEGADIVIADLLADRAAETAAAVEERGRKALVVELDATSAESNQAMAAAALETFGQIDVLVTAAGITHGNYRSGDVEREMGFMATMANNGAAPGNSLRFFDLTDWQRVLDVNLTGTMLAVAACGPSMADRGSGSIITLASIAAKNPAAGPVAYTVSKAGVWMLTKSVARDLAPAGVRVNAIGPGFIDTAMVQTVASIDEVRTQMLSGVPMGRLGRAEEIAATALFLAGDDSSFVTGEIFHVDGGYFTE